MQIKTLQRILFTLLALLLFSGGMVSAKESPASIQLIGTQTWPTYAETEGHNINRGPGGYLSLLKIIFLWIVFLIWVRAADWVNRDCYILRTNYVLWNSVVVFPFIATFIILALGIPIFFIGFLALLAATGGPIGAYVVVRNRNVTLNERVFTPEHIRYVFAQKARFFGLKIDAEKKAEHEKGAPVEFTPIAAPTDDENQANRIVARQSPGYVPAKNLVADAIDNRGERIMLNCSPRVRGVQYEIDGFWHKRQPGEREEGSIILAVLKKLANLDINERENRQEGKIEIEYAGTKYIGHLISQGKEGGERAVLHFVDPKKTYAPIAKLGMRPQSVEKLKEALAKEKGLVLLSAMPNGGLTTLTISALQATDLLMRDFVGVDKAENPEPPIINVDMTICEAGKTPADYLPDLLRKEPEVIVIPSIADGETAQLICEKANEDRLVIASLRAKDAPETLLRFMRLKSPAAEFAKAVTTVVNVRVVRKLCEDCKEAYAPEPKLLKKLGIPVQRVNTLYRNKLPKTGAEDEICETCNGIGFFGRTGIYEILTVDNTLRQILVNDPKLESLRKAAKQGGHNSLQEEGIVLVAKGITSLPELSRVLKQ